MLLPPGYTSLPSMKNTMRMRKALGAQKRHTARRADGERHGGGRLAADRARRAVASCATQTGAGQLVTMLQFGVLSDELTRRNMEMFASEVMPHLKN